MAEILIAKLTMKLACRLFSSCASDLLEGSGDVTEEKVRQALLSDFKKIHDQLDALRRKELVAAIAFLETGFEVLDKDEKTAKEEFRKARDAAQMAFGVVAEPLDKILATKVLVISTFHEFNDNLETAKSLCGKYLHRMNELPAVVQTCNVVFAPVKSFSAKLSSISGNAKRDSILDGAAEVNKCVYDYFKSMNTELDRAPVVKFDPYHINPVSDLMLNRRPVRIVQLDKCNSGFISVAMTTKFIFAALGKTTPESPENDIMAINLQDFQTCHLLGHAAAVLSLCANENILCSASYDKKIFVWDVDSLQIIKVLSGHEAAVRTVCLSDNYLFSGSSDCTVRVWSLENDFECVKVIEFPYYISKVTCSKRAFLFCLCGISVIQIWHAQKFTLLHSLTACDQALNVIANDARLFVSTKGVQGYAIQCWNLGSLTELAIIPQCGMNMTKYYNSPYLICGEDKLKMISTTSQRLLVEKQVVAANGRFIGKHIKHMWMDGVLLYVLSLDDEGKACIVRY